MLNTLQVTESFHLQFLFILQHLAFMTRHQFFPACPPFVNTVYRANKGFINANDTRYPCVYLFRTSVRESPKIVDVSRGAKHLKMSCLARDSSLSRSCPWLIPRAPPDEYSHRQIKKCTKYKRAITKNSGLIYNLLAHWEFTQRAFTIIKNTQI